MLHPTTKNHPHPNNQTNPSTNPIITQKNVQDFLPPPLKSSKFSLPPPKSSSSSLFASLPPAKSHVPDPQPLTKKVVQFRPPINPVSTNIDDEDEEDEDEKERKRRKAESALQAPSVTSFLSSIPAPRNSIGLGSLGSGLGTGRKSVIDADVQGTSLGSANLESEVDVSGTGGESGVGDYSSYANFEGYSGGEGYVEYSSLNVDSGDNLSNVSDYGSYASYGQYQDNWSEGSLNAQAPEVPIERALRLPTKRGRRDDPPQIIEVSQDDLMKNRPREDQAKMTGIAFGPAYQPASSKGKPTKLHKRKHQIGALYFDMKQKETELAERRSKGFLTKAQTQGKYGW